MARRKIVNGSIIHHKSPRKRTKRAKVIKMICASRRIAADASRNQLSKGIGENDFLCQSTSSTPPQIPGQLEIEVEETAPEMNADISLIEHDENDFLCQSTSSTPPQIPGQLEIEVEETAPEMNADISLIEHEQLCAESEDECRSFDDVEWASSDEEYCLITENSQPERPLKEVVCGRRAVDVAHLLPQLENLARHGNTCTLGRFVLTKEVRRGLHCTWIFTCDNCDEVRHVTTDKQGVNEALVWGSVSTGFGFSQTEELLGVMEVPMMSPQFYRKLESDIGENWEEHLIEKMKAAGEEGAKIARSKGHFVNDYPCITVIGDMGWAKRTYGHGYNSSSGVAVIIGAETNKVLYLGVKNSFCSTCARSKINNADQRKGHVCFKNFDGPATAMEQAAIVDGFKESIETHGLIYKYYIGDGDSSTMAGIQTRVSYGRLVEKIECANHVTRALHDNLQKLAKNSSHSLSVRKLLSSTDGGVSRIERLVKGVRCAIKEAGKEENSGAQLRADLKNAPYHVFGRHSNCRASFCRRKEAEEPDLVQTLQEGNLLAPVMKIIDNVVRKADMLVTNQTTNQAERYMGLVAKFVGGKRVNHTLRGSYERRAIGAALSHTSGPSWHVSPLKRLFGRSPGSICKSLCNKRSKKCVRRAAARQLQYSEPHKSKKRKKRTNFAGADKYYGPEAAEADVTNDALVNKMTEILNNMIEGANTRDKCITIERDTVGQHVNKKWREARLNRLTASQFGKIIRRRKTTPCNNHIKSILYSPPTLNTSGVIFGREHEDHVLQMYAEKKGVKVEKCGLFINPAYPYLGASPDGVVPNSNLLEIKCLPSVDCSLHEAALGKKICLELVEGNLHLRKNHQYYYQIQGQLNICEREVCDLVVFTKAGELFIEKIERDSTFWNTEMLPKLKAFFMQSMLPELADPRIIRGLLAREPNEVPSLLNT